jgi:F-type H+-transporting ATPase subunit alpha
MKKVAGSLRLGLAQYRELAAFAQFGTDLDPATRQQPDRGARLTEILKQGQYEPMPVGEQVAIVYAGVNGYLDDVPVEEVKSFEQKFLKMLKTKHFDVLDQLSKEVTPAVEEQLKRLVESFKIEHASSRH